ncbi:MAG TPA: PTS sugar transporter subunit IIA [Syntrophorhabdaceae bacterium]|nr:PTS sugar transporter subunit IIA [Syntrophorhabdaceae bacterium]
MKLADILKESCVIADIKGTTKRDVLLELVLPLEKAHLLSDVDGAVNIIMEREKLGSTGIGDGVAIPHGKMKNLRSVLCAVGRSQKGVNFDAVDEKPVHIFFLVLAPEESAGLHLKVLSRISKVLRDQSFRKRMLNMTDAHDIYAEIIAVDDTLS